MKSNKLFVVLYFLLNLLVTYMLTSSSLNPNIITFDRTVASEISSIIGNVSILAIILLVGLLFIRKDRSLQKYLLIITLLLNIVMILLIYFTRSFKTMLSFSNLTLFRNPNAGFAYQVVLDGLNEIVLNWQFVCLLPFIILLIVYLLIRKNGSNRIKVRFRLLIILIILALFSSFFTTLYFENGLKKHWPFRSEIAAYGIHSSGVYNYYFQELVIGLDYNEEYYERIKDEDDNLSSFNKGTTPNISILEGMNLFMIQAEALQNFVIPLSIDNKLVMPYMNLFLEKEDVFFFNNLHSVVGLGNTSDAEFAVNTGYYPLGDLTIVWEVNDKLFDIQSLPKMFPSDYMKYSYNPTIEDFYAHKYVHEKFYEFDEFKGFESFNKRYSYSSYLDLYLHKKWVSDKAILEFALSDGIRAQKGGNNFYIFAQTITPHYPFVDLKAYQNKVFNVKNVSDKFNNYLNQVNYIDKILYEFLINAEEKLPNTVFIIYGDHSNTLSKKDYETLYNKKLSDFEYQKILLEVPFVVYDPSSRISKYLDIKNLEFEKIKGRTLSQIDIFSTIKSLFNLTCKHNLGVNAFSNESSFAIEPKNLDLITDSFIYNFKNSNYYLYSDMKFNEMFEIIEKLKKFKLANDNYLTKKIGSKSK